MNELKMVLVHEEGVLGYMMSENKHGARVCWYVDGLYYESFLELDEYTVKLVGKIGK